MATAERFGFNRDPGLVGAARSTLPAAPEVGDDLAVGSTAIGQGQVLATPLLMAGIAAAVAEAGLQPRPTLREGAPPRRAASPAPVARIVRRFMREVVKSGTGVAAAIPGVAVAGKTGTAELRDTTNDDPPPEGPDAARHRPTSPTPTPGSPPSHRPGGRASRWR